MPALADNGKASHYIYDAGGERVIKSLFRSGCHNNNKKTTLGVGFKPASFYFNRLLPAIIQTI